MAEQQRYESNFPVFRCSFFECFGRRETSDSLSIVEIYVHMDCEGCERRIRKAISKLDGVDTLVMDMDKQKVTVTGYVDRRRVLRAVRRTGRQAEFWPYPYDSEYHPYMSQYYDETSFAPTHNYYRHGYNSSDQGYFPVPIYSTLDDNTVATFSDDNVNACSIM